MTLTNVISSGSGRIAARWEIEGCSIQVVTEPGMEQTISSGNFTGVKRICCTSLEDSGFSIEESVNIPEAKLEVQTTTLNLWENVAEDLADVFSHRPAISRFCAVTFDDAATTITMLSTSGINAGDVVHSGTEAIKVGAISSNDLTNCTRGYWGTVKRKHWASDTANVPELLITDRPLRWRGRRVELYLYGDDDPLTGDGAVVWRGVIADEPRLVGNGTEYQLAMAGNAQLLDAKLGGDLEEPVTPRGIYYHAMAGIHFDAYENQSGTPVGAIGAYTGFTESQTLFLADFNTWLATLTAPLDSTYRAVSISVPPYWTVEVTIGSGTTSLDQLIIESMQDGRTARRQADMYFRRYGGVTAGTRTLSTGNRLLARWTTVVPGAGTVPRGYYGRSTDIALHSPADSGTHHWHRIYVSRAVAATWTGATVEFEGADGWDATANIWSIRTADNSFQWGGFESGGRQALYNFEQPAKIEILRELIYDGRPAWAGFGTVAEAMQAITDEAVDYGDLGTAPFIVASDVRQVSWDGIVRRVATVPWQRSKRYYLASPIDLVEFLSHELRAIACYPITNSVGQIAIRPIEIPNSKDASIVDITEEVLFIDDDAQSLSTMVRGNQTINRVVFRTGYDAIEDEWSGSETVNDINAQALDHQDRVLEVESRGFADVQIMPGEAAVMALPVLTLFGYPHDFWAPKVPWTLFNLRLGTPVTFDAAHLPDFATGNRPCTDVLGIVVSRKWRLGEAHGELQILVSWQNVAGYSPTARINSQSNTVDETWDLTVDHTKYAPLGTDLAVEANVDTFFAAADQVRVIKVDSESTTIVVGEVDAVDTATHVITVTFDATWTPGTDTWDLIFDHYDATGVTADQKTFAAFAGTDLLLGSDNSSPRRLA